MGKPAVIPECLKSASRQLAEKSDFLSITVLRKKKPPAGKTRPGAQKHVGFD